MRFYLVLMFCLVAEKKLGREKKKDFVNFRSLVF